MSLIYADVFLSKIFSKIFPGYVIKVILRHFEIYSYAFYFFSKDLPRVRKKLALINQTFLSFWVQPCQFCLGARRKVWGHHLVNFGYGTFEEERWWRLTDDTLVIVAEYVAPHLDDDIRRKSKRGKLRFERNVSRVLGCWCWSRDGRYISDSSLWRLSKISLQGSTQTSQ